MRLFVALTLDEGARERIAAVQVRLADRLERGSVVPPENLHLTLAFIGEVAEEDVSVVEDALDDVASDPVLDLCFDHVGSFGRRGTGSSRGKHAGGRTVWLGCEQDTRLEHLQAEVADKLRGIGAELEERPFTPHVTLARHAVLADDVDLDALVGEPIPSHVSSYSLMESQLGPEGAVYEPLCTWE